MSLDLPRARKVAIVSSLLLGTFLASIEVTIVSTAMPVVARSLGGRELYPWVFSAYLVTSTATIPLYGKLADLLGRKPVFAAGIGLFMLGSGLCGQAPTMGWLIAWRTVQGLGAGSILPLTMTIFGDLFEARQRARLQGLFSMVWGVSAVAGPLLGGWLTENWSWRWVFYLNLPFGTLSLLGLHLSLPRLAPRDGGARPRLDWAGFLLTLGAVGAALLTLLPEPQRAAAGLGPPLPWGLAALAGAAALVAVERRAIEPVVPLDLLRDRAQAAANLGGVLLGAALLGVISFLPLYLQEVARWTPTEAGQALIPVTVGWTTAALASGQAFGRFGFQPVVRLGGALVAVGTAGIAARVMGAPPWALFVGTAAFGLGMGCSVTSFTVAVQERVPGRRRGVATALTQFSRSMGGAVGTAALGAMLAGAADDEAGLQRVFLAVAGSGSAAAAIALALFPSARIGDPLPGESAGGAGGLTA